MSAIDYVPLSPSEPTNEPTIAQENNDNYNNNDNNNKNPSALASIREQSIQILSNVPRIKYLYLSLLRNSKKEVLLIFPTTNAVRREERVGVFSELRQASQRGVTVRLLTPVDDFVSPLLDGLRTAGIIVRQIESPAETKFKLLIIDRKVSLVIETRDDTKGTFEQAIGLATFSNSKPTVMPYVTIFESFWRETDLYEKASEADRIKDEFINIAAHELRNPISPIVGVADFVMQDIQKLKESKGDNETLDSLAENVNIIVRNASKLHKLSEDILQVSRIESGTFGLHLNQVDVKALCEMVVQEARKRIEVEKKPLDIRSDYKLANNLGRGGFELFCDSSKISQVLHNLLDNAIKFTHKGIITVSATMPNESTIMFKVEDSGVGIDHEIKARLFDKFASRSDGGTGLGLYLSKKIVEAHGGNIWGANNASGIGATFAFTLPTDLRLIVKDDSISLENSEPHLDIQRHY